MREQFYEMTGNSEKHGRSSSLVSPDGNAQSCPPNSVPISLLLFLKHQKVP